MSMHVRVHRLVPALLLALAVIGGTVAGATNPTAIGDDPTTELDLASEADLAVAEHGLATGISRGEPQGVGTEFSTRTDEIYAYATFRDRGDGNVSWDEVNAAYDWEFRGPGGQVRSGTMWIASGDQSTASETRTYFAALGLHSGFAYPGAAGEWTLTVTRDGTPVYTDTFVLTFERPLWQELGIYVAGALGVAGVVLVGIFVGLRTLGRRRKPESS
jgi:hypothetical protein